MSPRTVNIGPCACCGAVACTDCPTDCSTCADCVEVTFSGIGGVSNTWAYDCADWLNGLTLQLAKSGSSCYWGLDGGYYLHPNGFLYVDLSCVQLTSTGAYVWQLAVAFDGEFGPDEGPCWYSSGEDCACPPFTGNWTRNTSIDDYCDSCDGGTISLAECPSVVPCSDCLDAGTCDNSTPDEVVVDLSAVLAAIPNCPECTPNPPCSPDGGSQVTLYKQFDCGFWDNVVCLDGYDLHVFIDWAPYDFNNPSIGYWSLTVFCYFWAVDFSWFGCKDGNSPVGTYTHGCTAYCLNDTIPTITVNEP